MHVVPPFWLRSSAERTSLHAQSCPLEASRGHYRGHSLLVNSFTNQTKAVARIEPKSDWAEAAQAAECLR